ncbi:uncharacterized protein LOC118446898 isoform X2 [Vespa mandarinia]|uniref:uncharacterized protein LOC118446898 isoform X2 n=1 Tax=Vespa mandarinia TaxID=7446 RepID=UPI00161160F6|nr:uncharacterized protein LOC118446898 isoform X2 [Vespa mandarinia]
MKSVHIQIDLRLCFCKQNVGKLNGFDRVNGMSNENAAVCGCGITVDVSRRKVPIWRHSKSDGRSSKKQQNDGRGSKNRNSETGSTSTVTDHAKPMTKSSKQEKRFNRPRRSVSAGPVIPDYTYINPNSNILNGPIRETISEALYVTIPDTPNAMANDTGNSLTNSQNRSPPVYTIPSMTSPPPTYDATVAKSWQSGLPPTYEEYLCHEYEMIPRSHTPPPPWSDSTTNSSSTRPSSSVIRTRRELGEYFAQLTMSQNNEYVPLYQAQQHQQQQQHSGTVHRDIGGYLTNKQVCREQQIRAQQRTRPMPPRSQSESRAQQQRIATMYEDGAFCMETTALTSMFEHGVAFCSLM